MTRAPGNGDPDTPVNHSTKCHERNFVESLTSNQRNALRIILAHEGCLGKLRRALGTQLTETISENQRKTGLAKLGRTAELFDQLCVAANIRHA
jgi:hypothetical protein